MIFGTVLKYTCFQKLKTWILHINLKNYHRFTKRNYVYRVKSGLDQSHWTLLGLAYQKIEKKNKKSKRTQKIMVDVLRREWENHGYSLKYNKLDVGDTTKI